MLGTSDTTFSPVQPISRSMMATILWHMEGSPAPDGENPFTAVPAGEYYTNESIWTKEKGIFEGYGGLFGSGDSITCEQFVTVLWRYAQYRGYDVSVGKGTNILSYNDAFEISEYAIPAMQWAVGEGIVGGKGGGILDPKGKATRAEAAVVLTRFLEDEE